jgi:hypothetical protein
MQECVTRLPLITVLLWGVPIESMFEMNRGLAALVMQLEDFKIEVQASMGGLVSCREHNEDLLKENKDLVQTIQRLAAEMAELRKRLELALQQNDPEPGPNQNPGSARRGSVA